MKFDIKKQPWEVTHRFKLGDKVKIVREIDYHNIHGVFPMHEVNNDWHKEFLSSTRIGEEFVVNSIFITNSMAYYGGPEDYILDNGLAVPEVNLELVSSKHNLEYSYDGGIKSFIDSYDKLLEEFMENSKYWVETNKKHQKLKRFLEKEFNTD